MLSEIFSPKQEKAQNPMTRMKIFLGTLKLSDAPAIAKIYHCMNAVEYDKRMQEISVNLEMN